MPWCSGKVTVPFGCSTALVMNRRPGHAPQPPPPVVDAPAGMAAALAEMAIAISAVTPSAILTNLILSKLVIFTGCPFLWRGHQPGRRPKAPAVSLTPLASAAARILRALSAPTRAPRARPSRADKTNAPAKPQAKVCCRPSAKRRASRNTREVIRCGRRPGLVPSQQLERRISRQHEAGKDQVRTDHDSQGR